MSMAKLDLAVIVVLSIAATFSGLSAYFQRKIPYLFRRDIVKVFIFLSCEASYFFKLLELQHDFQYYEYGFVLFVGLASATFNNPWFARRYAAEAMGNQRSVQIQHAVTESSGIAQIVLIWRDFGYFEIARIDTAAIEWLNDYEFTNLRKPSDFEGENWADFLPYENEWKIKNRKSAIGKEVFRNQITVWEAPNGKTIVFCWGMFPLETGTEENYFVIEFFDGSQFEREKQELTTQLRSAKAEGSTLQAKLNLAAEQNQQLIVTNAKMVKTIEEYERKELLEIQKNTEAANAELKKLGLELGDERGI